MYKASIDIGSNSMLLLLIDQDDRGNFRELVDESRVTALGKDLDRNLSFCEESMNASRKAFADFEKILKQEGVEAKDVIVTATEAARVAHNAMDFFTEIKNNYGFNVTIISGAGEAFYTALGVMKGIDDQESMSVVMDIGGASTELILIDRSRQSIIESVSLPIGSVRAQDWLDVSFEHFDSKASSVVDSDELMMPYKTQKLVCVAGTMTSIGAMILGIDEYRSKVVHNSRFTRSDFDKLIHKLPNDPSSIGNKYPYLGKRAKTIKAGALVAQKIADKLGVSCFEISTYGLRYGVALSGKIDDKFVTERC